MKNSTVFSTFIRKSYFSIVFTLFTFVSSFGQIKVDQNGHVALGSTVTNPYYPVYSTGNMYVWGELSIDPNAQYSWLMFREDQYGDCGLISGNNALSGTIGSYDYEFFEMWSRYIYQNRSLVTSDEWLKENIKSIDRPLSKLLNTKGYRYDYKDIKLDSVKSEKKRAEIEKKGKNRLGFLAQELMQTIPEAVVHVEGGDRYYIDYDAIIPVLVEAMKEQQAKIDELEIRIGKLEGKGNEKSAVISTGSMAAGNETATLAQNVPNPFGTTTRIGIFLPQTVSNARLYVYNMQGAQIRSFNINDRGNTHVTIEGYSLEAGMYLYTLVADGKEVDTKKMILTK